MEHCKISIIGTGAVGSSIAYALLQKNITAHIQLIDSNEDKCRGELLDLSDTLAFCYPSLITSGSIKDARTSKIIIIAAGQRQKTGQNRTDLYNNNKDTVAAIFNELQEVTPSTIIVMVTNPLDLLTTQAQTQLSLPKSQLFGTGTFLDTQRLHGIISKKLDIERESIQAYVLGEHGETQFVAWSSAYISGIPIKNFLSEKVLDSIAQETKDRAFEIISCKGATYWGIATCTAAICEAILFDQKRILPLSVYHQDLNICLSMPVVLGINGVEQIMEIPLDQNEKSKLMQSADTLKKLL